MQHLYVKNVMYWLFTHARTSPFPFSFNAAPLSISQDDQSKFSLTRRIMDAKFTNTCARRKKTFSPAVINLQFSLFLRVCNSSPQSAPWQTRKRKKRQFCQKIASTSDSGEISHRDKSASALFSRFKHTQLAPIFCHLVSQNVHALAEFQEKISNEEKRILYSLVHLSSLLSSSEPMKQFGVPSHRCDNSKSCSTVVDSLTWHPKYPSSRFRKKISRFIPKPTPPWLLACKKKKKTHVNEAERILFSRQSWKSALLARSFINEEEKSQLLIFLNATLLRNVIIANHLLRFKRFSSQQHETVILHWKFDHLILHCVRFSSDEKSGEWKFIILTGAEHYIINFSLRQQFK